MKHSQVADLDGQTDAEKASASSVNFDVGEFRCAMVVSLQGWFTTHHEYGTSMNQTYLGFRIKTTSI